MWNTPYPAEMFPQAKGFQSAPSNELPASDHFSNNSRPSAFAGPVLIVNPAISLFQADAERSVRFPTQVFPDERVVAVAAVHTFGRGQVVVTFKSDACEALGQIYELVDGDGLARAQIDGVNDVRVHDHIDAFDAVIYEHEAARLVAGTPDFDLVSSRQFGFDDFTTN